MNNSSQKKQDPQSGILEGYKVLELASVLAGPSVGMFLAELGATVLKVENPRTDGDVTRSWKLASESTDATISSYFSAVNWGKQSLGVDLQKAKGQAIITELAADADIVLTSFKPGDAERLGLNYEAIAATNPGLIYGDISGFGMDDNRVGYDAIIQAEAGFTYLNGEPDSGPLKMPVALMDLLAAHQLKQGILTALLKRQQTGQGDFISASLLQSGIASLANQATNWLVGGEIPQRMGSKHPNIAPYGDILYTADKEALVLAVGNDRQFTGLCEILGIDALVNDPSYKTNAQRVKNREHLLTYLSEAFAKWTSDKLVPKLQKSSIPIGRVLDMKAVMESPQAQAMLMTAGDLKGLRTIAFGSQEANHTLSLSPPPPFGQDTKSVLTAQLSYNPGEIDLLLSNGVLHGGKELSA